MPVDATRDAAIDVLLRVFDRGMHLDRALDKTLRRKTIPDRGRRFLTELVYGTVRNAKLADYILAPLLNQPIHKLPLSIRIILRMGVHQCLFCDSVTFPAMVHTSVDLAKKRGHAGTARLTNAVLKRVPKSLDDVEWPSDPAERLEVRYSLPRWLVGQWIEALGLVVAERVAAASVEQAPSTIRVNTQATSVDELTALLSKAGATVEKQTCIPDELTLVSGKLPHRLKAFQNGLFTMQDAASMLPAHLLDPQNGEIILDMCAAPGGKALHAAHLAPEAQIIAMDREWRRLPRLLDNKERLNTPNVHAVAGDGTNPPVTGPFSRVLVDAPCSGLGTLRRHPDIKLNMRPRDLRRMAKTQGALLRSAIRLCENGGVIVYSVCTFSKDETVEIVESVINDEPVTFEDGPEWLSQWKISQGQYRTLPVSGGLDGFFLTRLRKQS